MREGDQFIVPLTTKEGRREVFPYVRNVIRNAKEGMLTSPGGMVREDRGLKPEHITSALTDYVIDFEHPELVSTLASVANFMIFQAKSLNPYDPKAVQTLTTFTNNFDAFSQQFAQELWEYEKKELTKAELEAKAKGKVNLRVIGMLAAGKTTFLNTIVKSLDLKENNLGVYGYEPEDAEDYYPDLSVMNHYQYRRNMTRGSEATFGSEGLKLFGFNPGKNKLTEISIHSSGGHMQADRPPPYVKFNAGAFFTDFQSIKRLSQLDRSVGLDHVLPNQETVLETCLSLIARLQEWEQMAKPKIIVVTKFPNRQDISKATIDSITHAYNNVLAYSRHNYAEMRDTAVFSGIEVKVPDSVDLQRDTTEWLPIYNNAPTFSGAEEVLNRLAEIGFGEKMQLVTFNKPQNSRQVYYTQALQKAR